MNDHELEQLLGRLPLRAPSAKLDERVRSAGRPKRAWLWLVGSLAVAAAVVLAITYWPQGVKPATNENKTVAQTTDAQPPVRMEQNWEQVTYEGTVSQPDGVPVRAWRRQTLRHVELRQPDGAVMQMTVPEEKIYLVAAQVY